MMEKKEPEIFKNQSIDILEKHVIIEIKDLECQTSTFSQDGITGTIFTLAPEPTEK